MYLNHTNVTDAPYPLRLDTLDSLNDLGNIDVYLTSRDHINVDKSPAWTYGVTPDERGDTSGAIASVIIVNAHDKVHVDVYYMYFYALVHVEHERRNRLIENSFNWGGKVLGTNLGNHVGGERLASLSLWLTNLTCSQTRNTTWFALKREYPLQYGTRSTKVVKRSDTPLSRNSVFGSVL